MSKEVSALKTSELKVYSGEQRYMLCKTLMQPTDGVLPVAKFWFFFEVLLSPCNICLLRENYVVGFQEKIINLPGPTRQNNKTQMKKVISVWSYKGRANLTLLGSWIAKIRVLNLQQTCFSVSVRTHFAISLLLVVLKPGCPYLPWKAPEDEEKIQESTSLSLAAAKEISVDTAVAAVLSELGGLKEE